MLFRSLAGQLEFAVVPAFSGVAGLKSRLFLRTPELLVSSRRSPLAHLAPVRLCDLGPLKLVVPSQANTRRRLIETYLASNGVRLERLLELDAMLGTLDFVARTDWIAILPALMMGIETRARLFCVNPIVSPPFSLDLVLDTDLTEASRSDKLADTVGYDQVVEIATKALDRKSVV